MTTTRRSKHSNNFFIVIIAFRMDIFTHELYVLLIVTDSGNIPINNWTRCGPQKAGTLKEVNVTTACNTSSVKAHIHNMEAS